ncbi:ArsB/NhaD family transporter [Texcoconibacillus texcoconensis]|uniref:Na+/H+ antiporter NhaD/arsenite permease-like protein n=1 Tax=Texcoconibacillus texcoconensis TaxID=1095777 RepID=A0A840QPG1_9BACI|nr:ArsB/NhaD family transporter [Texcoconibacillus texcoconensis]MBB5173207.1 Na+/H+ antiporter NhaD/arsenite permease-like protein [Texcoconibacillus texcoconensis]
MEVTAAFLIFVISYIFIMTEKVNRALVACFGGVLMLFVGVLDLDATFVEHIDWHTIVLLLSMMILVSITSQSGFFEYVAIKVAQLIRGRPILLLIFTATMTGVGSAFLNNVTMVLLIVPIILTLTRMLEVSAIPYLLATILASNIGGTATLIGDPPNLMIGQAVDHLTFNSFLVHLGPVVIVVFIVVMVGVALLYRKQLTVSVDKRKALMSMDPKAYLGEAPLLFKSLMVLTMTTVGFMLQPILQVELTSIAMAGALLLMLLTQREQDTEEVLGSVEWVTLFFFIGLFMLVGGLQEVGIIDEIAKSIIYYTEGDVPKTSMLILWVSGILSGFVDNIPFVAAMIPVILEFQEYGMQDLDPLWWALALGACLGGNGTLIGASSNVIVAGLAIKAKQPFTYMDFLKIGAPTALISFIISSVYLYVRYLMPLL